MTVQPGLCWTWSETQIVGFLMHRLKCFSPFPFSRVYDDMDVVMTEDNKETLLTGNEECTINLINLLLTGRATKYLHNGNVHYDNEGKMLVGWVCFTNEPVCEKINNLGSDPVRHKLGCTVTEDG